MSKYKALTDIRMTPRLLADAVANRLLGQTVSLLCLHAKPQAIHRMLDHESDRCGKGKGMVRAHQSFRAAQWLIS